MRQERKWRGAQDLPLYAKRLAVGAPEPCLELRHHLSPTAAGICLPRGDPGPVKPGSGGPAFYPPETRRFPTPGSKRTGQDKGFRSQSKGRISLSSPICCLDNWAHNNPNCGKEPEIRAAVQIVVKYGVTAISPLSDIIRTAWKDDTRELRHRISYIVSCGSRRFQTIRRLGGLSL